MQVTADWREGIRFEVATGSGHEFTVDGPPDHGGVNAGPRPMELMLASAAVCSGIDVVDILGRGKREFSAVRVVATGERASEPPAVFTRIQLHFVVAGAEARHAQRAVELSATKYCSALRMLEASAQIDWDVETPAALG